MEYLKIKRKIVQIQLEIDDLYIQGKGYEAQKKENEELSPLEDYLKEKGE